MKNASIAVTAVALLMPVLVAAQNTAEVVVVQKDVAASMDVFVFPGEGQSGEQQSTDQGECYKWAVERTGSDPYQLAKQAEAQAVQGQQAQQEANKAGKGSGAAGAVVGAGAGALIGEIASDDAGKGAAWGAAAGLVVGRRARRRQQAGAQQQAAQETNQAQQATQKQIDDFRKAFSVCLEAKGYTVRL